MPTCMHATVALLATLLLAGCAVGPSAGVSAAVVRAGERQRAVERADARAAMGCYLPMSEALAGYDVLLAEADDEAVRTRAFEVATLLAMRERLIGLYPGRHQDAPARLASGLPPDLLATAALDVLDLTEWRRGTRPPSVSEGSFVEMRRRAVRAHAALRPLADRDVRAAKLLVHLLAAVPFASLPVDAPLGTPGLVALSLDSAPWAKGHLAMPSFGVAWLFGQRGTSAEEWAAWLEAHPTCVEVHVPMADHALAARRLLSTDTALSHALEALPALVPARVMRGDIRVTLGDYESALGYFAEVIRDVPAHREARLGQLVALSNLLRHDEALGVADEMIALGEWYLGEALYWKAWNLFHQRRLADARASLVEAKRLLYNADVFYLSALIAFQEEQWDEARTELAATIGLDGQHCDARFTLAAVHLMTRVWMSADETFDTATTCFEAREPALAAAVAEVAEAPLSSAQRDILRTRRQQQLEATVTQKQWARYNRAVALANRGEREQARLLADDVAQHGETPGPASAASDLLLQLGPDGRPVRPARGPD